MIVEIHGAGFQNKGAELMLRAVVDELRQRLPQFVPAIDPAYGAYNLRCGLALNQVIPPRSHVGSDGFSKRFRGQKLFASLRGEKLLARVLGAPLSTYGCVSLAGIQGLIDIAGFAYTDEWGSRPTQDFASLTAYYKAKGKPVVLLPQAFGPFQRNETKSAFRNVLENATLVFARDQQSYEYAFELSSESGKVMHAPDITLFYPDVSLEMATDQDKGYVCVVPNIRILDQGKQSWGDKYQSYLLEIVRELLHQNLRVNIVVHDASGDDLILARYLCDKTSSPAVTLIQEEDPIALKQLLAGSSMLIGSRYHSLVAAFSKHVPAIALGWSHKYTMLFRDFGCEQYVVSPDTSIEAVLQHVRALVDRDTNASCRQQIAHRLREMYRVNQAMWARVVDILIAIA